MCSLLKETTRRISQALPDLQRFKDKLPTERRTNKLALMAIAAVIGLTAGKRLLSTSFYPLELTDRVLAVQDNGSGFRSSSPVKSFIIAQKKSNFGSNCSSGQQKQGLRACKEPLNASTVASTTDSWFIEYDFKEEDDCELESSLESILLLQKSILEKQLHLSLDQTVHKNLLEGRSKTDEVVRSGLSARQRRNTLRARNVSQKDNLCRGKRKPSLIIHDLQQNQSTGSVRGSVSETILSHIEVTSLCEKLKLGLSLEKHKRRLETKLGYEPSDRELASYLRISPSELNTRLTECSLAREKLVMSNMRLVRSIAQKYDNLGAQGADLVQGGVLGLLRGIEKYDPSKGFKMSTYVYWWIRRGISKVLFENSTPLRIPLHMHRRLFSIKAVKTKLEDQGITPTIDRIAEALKISQTKVRNATEAANRIVSLDSKPFPSLSGQPSETYHSYVADPHLENNPWHGYYERCIKDEVKNLLDTALLEREREIIRLYHGLDSKNLTWEEIGKQIGLSRERVRKVGLVALEKLKHAAREKRLEAMYLRH